VNSANSEAVAADDGIEPEVTLDQARATIPEEGANKMVWKIKNESTCTRTLEIEAARRWSRCAPAQHRQLGRG
jgi:hypothetical protein